MKQLVLILAFTTFLCLTHQTKAQQAKAYETVKYRAQKSNMIFQLNYADGYIGATQVNVKKAQSKLQVFSAESGAPELNGNFILRPQQDADKREITLFNISEETEAPKVIRGSYHDKNIILNLVFTRVGK